MDRIHVLIADDHPADLLTLQEVLADPNYELVTAMSGRDVLRQLLDQDFAVILLDVHMPDMDGFETAELIRTREKDYDVPIIFVTGLYQEFEQAVRAYNLNAVDYILKPFEPLVLKTKVHVLVELFRKTNQARQQAIDLQETNLRLQAEIARRQQAEEILTQQTEKLMHSNAELEQFAYVASHDLQEPLRVITSYLQMLDQRYHSQLGEDADKFISRAVAASARMKVLINDLLAYSRVTTQGTAFALTDLSQVLDRALQNLQISLDEAHASLTFDPMPTVHVDPEQIMQIFQNLIDNALKFRSTNTPVIHVGAEHQNGAWLLSVRDNGIGIEATYFDRIFVIFQRLHTRQEYSGTGIGLAICKKIVERHGGRIWVESQPGQGSVFYFTLPD